MNYKDVYGIDRDTKAQQAYFEGSEEKHNMRIPGIHTLFLSKSYLFVVCLTMLSVAQTI
jgi:hypothetical protein